MSKVREDALRGQEIQSFSYDFDKDLLKGVIVTPKTNNIAIGIF